MEVRPDSAERILIVDDDELVRKSAATLMASLGYRVLSAGSGSEVLEVLRQDGPIDLLFTAEIRHALDPSIEQVSKPYERDALAAILRRTLSARGGVADDRPTDREQR